ncbi:hypothetical protein CHS0354_042025 [Potamilus streckersoni]|uniref:UBC core domain-containing protein n=1 Tax=Potamilus streckersoni TaxID=2493646 RepID=A0AAE0T9Z9_9BIVA|nr:hypothetical protein CHS0354_042025 [Potamilus streckersoni]
MALFSTTKEIQRLANKLGKLSQNQARIVDFGVEKGNSSYLKVEIIPSSGYYKGGKILFKIYLNSTFPATPPRVWCCTNIYHPNIDVTDMGSDSNVCLNMFESDGWFPGYGIEGCIMGLLFLMHNPCLQDPLSPFFSLLGEDDSFADKVKKSLKPGGGEVDGFRFEGNSADPCNSLDKC